jgi:hypothetical protein
MRELRSSGSVRGASGDGRPYRKRIYVTPIRAGEVRLPIRQQPFAAGRAAGVIIPTGVF